MLWTTKVWIGRDSFSADWLQRQSLKTLRVLVLWWNGKQMCTSCNFLFLFIIFFEITLEPLCHTKQNNKYIFNHPPTKPQGWHFVWQNGYGRSTLRLVCSDFMSIFSETSIKDDNQWNFHTLACHGMPKPKATHHWKLWRNTFSSSILCPIVVERAQRFNVEM